MLNGPGCFDSWQASGWEHAAERVLQNSTKLALYVGRFYLGSEVSDQLNVQLIDRASAEAIVAGMTVTQELDFSGRASQKGIRFI